MHKMLVGFVMLATLHGFGQNSNHAKQDAAQEHSVEFQPLNVRTGLWQNTLTTTIGGDALVPANVLSHLSPARRAKMEAAMRERAAEGGHTTTYQSCVTAQELKEAPFADKQDCTSTLLSSSSTEIQIQLSCDMEGAKAEGTLQLRATSATSVEGSGSGSASSDGQTMTTSSVFQGHWVKSDCGDVK